MCNNTSLSNFLDGVNFLDEATTGMELEVMETDLLDACGVDNTIMLDEAMAMDEEGMTMAAVQLEMQTDPLPPLDLAVSMEHADLDALLSPPTDTSIATPPITTTSTPVVPMPTTSTTQPTQSFTAPYPPHYHHPHHQHHHQHHQSANTSPTSLEKLAHCMRTSELALAQMQTKANLQASQSPLFSKANHFFTGSAATITPELERSRQKVWSLIHQHQQQQQQAIVYTHKAPTTAAA